MIILGEKMSEADHKEIGRKLGLFSFQRQVPGTVFWWPKGVTLFNLIVDDLREKLASQGYLELKTPAIISQETLKNSGHWDNYRERLFLTGNEEEVTAKKTHWCLKPMNCPGSIMIFNEEMRSYKDLPLRFSEIGTVYRYEQPGEVNGLFRARALTIDDAHIYCAEEQMAEEIVKLIDFIEVTYKDYGFDEIRVELSSRPEKSIYGEPSRTIGTDSQWQKAEEGLKKALKAKKLSYKENKGEGAFYGPKIDFHIKDSLGRSWQMGTIQLDFSTAERLDAHYIDAKGQKQNPVIIHRAILGSVERFIAILLEHTGGVLPASLAPVQVEIIPVSEKFFNDACGWYKKLSDARVRVDVDMSEDSVGKKIRNAELQKIPYMLVIGEKEKTSNKLAVRELGSKDIKSLTAEEFIKRALKG